MLLDTYSSAIGFSLFFTTPLLELHGTHVHYRGSNFVDVIFFFLCEAQDIEGLLLDRNYMLKSSFFSPKHSA